MDRGLTPILLRLEAHRSDLAAKRLVDIVVAFTGLVLMASLMILIALVIYLDSEGPIFFSQIRLGQGGRRFRLYKFRKFHDKRAGTSMAVTLKDDARLTRVGKLLEQTKFNELPQLWNVLKGDMSIVGPRPESLDFGDCFSGQYRGVLDYKPGIFGPNQVFFRDECSFFPRSGDPQQFYRDVLFPLKARVDLAYFPYGTLFSDLAWTVRGVLAVFGKSPISRKTLAPLDEVEEWIRESRRRNAGIVR